MSKHYYKSNNNDDDDENHKKDKPCKRKKWPTVVASFMLIASLVDESMQC